MVMSFMPSCGHCLPARKAGRRYASRSGSKRQGHAVSGERRLHCGEVPVNHHLGVSGFADYAVVSRHSAVKIETDLPMVEARCSAVAVLTAS